MRAMFAEEEPVPPRGPVAPSDVVCAGGCGGWLPGPLGAGLRKDRCFPCWMGEASGRKNPYPPVPADRTAARFYLSQTELDAEWAAMPGGDAPIRDAGVPRAVAVLAGLVARFACAWWARKR